MYNSVVSLFSFFCFKCYNYNTYNFNSVENNSRVMPGSDKFCLKWNDFQENVNSAFSNMRKDNNFCDVTLACEDGYQVGAHKIILAASSPFFANVLNRNKHTHPLIYMRGLKSEDLEAVVDFLYYGEANIFEEKLQHFLAIAEDLKLKGLEGEETPEGTEEKHVISPKTTTRQKPKYNGLNKRISYTNKGMEMMVYQSNYYPEEQHNVQRTVALPKDVFSGEMLELDEKLKTMMVLGIPTGDKKTLYTCQVCGKEGQMMQIKDHIEVNHLEGIIIPCTHCDKTFRYINALRCHKRHVVYNISFGAISSLFLSGREVD